MSTEPPRAPGMIGTKVTAQKSAEIVAGQLRRQIVRRELLEGSFLPPENVLLEQFEVSRPTLREAYRILEAEALITVLRGSRGGARINAPDEDSAARYAGLVLEYRGATVADVYGARAIIEPACVRMLAVRAAADDVVQLRETLASMERSFGDWATFEQAARDFHRMLAVLTRSATIKLLIEMLARITTVAEQRNSVDLAGTKAHRDAASASLRAHRKVVGLIAAGEADAAETLWRKHTSAGATHVLNSIAAGTVLDLFS